MDQHGMSKPSLSPVLAAEVVLGVLSSPLLAQQTDYPVGFSINIQNILLHGSPVMGPSCWIVHPILPQHLFLLQGKPDAGLPRRSRWGGRRGD